MSLGSRGFLRPRLASSGDRLTDVEADALVDRAAAGVAYILFVVLFGWIIFWSFGHDERLRQRVAEEGCPFASDADVKRLPGAREREFSARYCDPIEIASN